jgi:hypothetical protein
MMIMSCMRRKPMGDRLLPALPCGSSAAIAFTRNTGMVEKPFALVHPGYR